MDSLIKKKAPNLKIGEWVQGVPTNIDKEQGKVIVVEVFQVNCPGCFLYGIPEAIGVYNNTDKSEVKVLGIATAFEDYDKNNLDNLKLLVTKGEVIGETLRALRMYGRVENGNKLPYSIPHPVAMDSLIKRSGDIQESQVLEFLEENVSGYQAYNEQDKLMLFERAKHYLGSKEFSALTFEEYKLKGTPSTILIDRKGLVRDIAFGADGGLKSKVDLLLKE
ncbi:MAG: TlpA family protein disulfide reductase [Nitrososphaeraceae archaeon]|nr:TlpA family protein disulfide reductase [Nitrososphaeraceae archaeon]